MSKLCHTLPCLSQDGREHKLCLLTGRKLHISWSHLLCSATWTEHQSVALTAGVETIAGGLATEGHVGDHLLPLRLLGPHDAPEPFLVLADVAVLHLAHQEVVPSLPPAGQTLELRLWQHSGQADTQASRANVSKSSLEMIPVTLGNICCFNLKCDIHYRSGQTTVPFVTQKKLFSETSESQPTASLPHNIKIRTFQV